MTLAGLAPKVPTASPAPDNGKVAVATLLVKATLPLALPLVCGANVTVRLELCPGASVTGKVNPLTLKPAPEGVALVIVTLLPPEFVMVAVWF